MNFGPFLIPLMGIMIPITAIVGAFVFVIIRTLAKSRVRELEIRERIAMIERGLVPAPEVDPRGFDRAMSRMERRGSRHGSGRHRRVAVTLMGVGFGLMVLIAFTSSEWSVAVGVGGFLVIIGAAFFINSLLEYPVDPYPPAGYSPTSSSSAAADPPRHD
jgi:hypothetical protein